ncbi:MAG: CoA ester lyase [Magnetococcales bacterium]|nr:CoA ester lyase [Magnetococcales bacterium]
MASTLLRSVLYVPGSNPKALAKAPGLGADALILDLEDSVAPEAKAAARDNIRTTLPGMAGQSLHRTVRINGVETSLWQADLDGVLPGNPEAITLPKVEHPNQVETVATYLAAREPEGKSLPIWAMIESPLGVLNAFAIATHPRVSCLVLGTSDLGKDLGVEATPEREALHTALQMTVLAARAAKVAVVDGVFLDLKDAAGLAAQCAQGVRFGFDGKTVIHPTQVTAANAAFLPSPEAVTRARALVASWQAARERGEEICVVDGRLVERLHVVQAERILDLARRAAEKKPA